MYKRFSMTNYRIAYHKGEEPWDTTTTSSGSNGCGSCQGWNPEEALSQKPLQTLHK